MTQNFDHLATDAGAPRAPSDRCDDDYTRFLRDLFYESEKRAGGLDAEVLRLEAAVAQARLQQSDADAELTTLRHKVATLEAEVLAKTSELANAHAALADFQRYPDAYPVLAEAGPYFITALEARPRALAPFIGIEAIEPLESDPYARRYRGHRGAAGCTIRIVRADVDADAETAEAWRMETVNALVLSRKQVVPGVAAVLDVGTCEHPGFAVFSRSDDPTLDRVEARGEGLRPS